MIMTWAPDNSDRVNAMLKRYANIMGQVGLFNFTVDSSGKISGSEVQEILDIIPKYPKVNWLLTIKIESSFVIEALLQNENFARDTFLKELQRLVSSYPWCKGLDINFKNCGGYDNRSLMKKLIRTIYFWGYEKGLMLNLCLPPIYSNHESDNKDAWCAYEDYVEIADTVTIMTHDPKLSKGELEQVVEYASKVIPKEKILLGVGTLASMCGLHQKLEDSNWGYYGALNWMQGGYNFLPSRQPYIPFTGYWNDYEKTCYLLPHVYDYVDGNMCSKKEEPLIEDIQNGRKHVASFTKLQKVNGQYNEVTQYSNAKGAVIAKDGYITSIPGPLSNSGEWEYNFTIQNPGKYTLALDMEFPWFNNNALTIKLDGVDYTIEEKRYWSPTFRKRHLEIFYEGYLSAGSHTVKCGAYGLTVGAITYGLCYGNFSIEMSAGQSEYIMSTQEFMDVNGNKVTPADNYAMTVETLRTPPSSANIWYEDYKEYSENGSVKYSDFWLTSGDYKILVDETKKLMLFGSSMLKGVNWKDVHVYAKWQGGSGRVGVTFGSLFACMNYSENQLQLWNGSVLVHAVNFSMNGEQAIAMRVRENSVRVYAGTNETLEFKIELNTTSASPGIRSTEETIFTLCKIGSGWWYEPHECYQMTVLGKTSTLGRIERTKVVWDEELQLFKVNEDIEESETRDEEISSGYDFQYMGSMPILRGKEYQDIPVVYKPIDTNIKHMRTYIGDADGFGIMHYKDADVLQYWYNRALYEYGLKGLCLGNFGQEDCRIWERIENKGD